MVSHCLDDRIFGVGGFVACRLSAMEYLDELSGVWAPPNGYEVSRKLRFSSHHLGIYMKISF
jgi:hypothetical protein